MDRLIRQAIYQGLMPLFDPDFSDYSYGFGPGRSAHDAVYQARKYIQQGYRVAVDFDLSKFFDTINHDKSRVALTSKVDFLGFSFRGTRIRWSAKAA